MADGTLSPDDMERQVVQKSTKMHRIQSQNLLKSLAARLSTVQEVASVTVARADTPNSNSASVSLASSPQIYNKTKVVYSSGCLDLLEALPSCRV